MHQKAEKESEFGKIWDFTTFLSLRIYLLKIFARVIQRLYAPDGRIGQTGLIYWLFIKSINNQISNKTEARRHSAIENQAIYKKYK